MWQFFHQTIPSLPVWNTEIFGIFCNADKFKTLKVQDEIRDDLKHSFQCSLGWFKPSSPFRYRKTRPKKRNLYDRDCSKIAVSQNVLESHDKSWLTIHSDVFLWVRKLFWQHLPNEYVCQKQSLKTSILLILLENQPLTPQFRPCFSRSHFNEKPELEKSIICLK